MPGPASPLIFSVEGNIGSGKSTFVRDLQTRLAGSAWAGRTVVFLQEPVDIWSSTVDQDGESILTKFYSDQKKYAFPFQMMAYISRQSLINHAIESSPNAIIISERCVHTDKHVFAKMLFDDGKIDDINYQIYNRWFGEFSKSSRYAGHVYLEASPETCSSRITKRGRTGEDIPLEYLARCNLYHDEWLAGSDSVLRLDANADSDNSAHCDAVLDYIAGVARDR
jgi:deoxyadenosine/deoxycytidine kinase